MFCTDRKQGLVCVFICPVQIFQVSSVNRKVAKEGEWGKEGGAE